jgi:hypothetical protein
MNTFLKNKEITQLIRSRLKWNKDNACTNAFQLTYHPEILKIAWPGGATPPRDKPAGAYETIKSNPGNMVKGALACIPREGGLRPPPPGGCR